MTMWGRSDISLISIPAPDGCGAQHTKEVTRGVPAKHIRVDCEPCEAWLSGARKPRVLKYHIDSKTGQAIRQERVADAEAGWSSTIDTVPLTPDEERTRGLKLEKGENQLRALESLLALKAGGIDLTSRPEVLFYLQESGLPSDTLRALKGSIVCANGHDAEAGVKFCPECGVSMAARGAIAPPEPDEPAPVDLGRLHVQSLRKMARDRGLPDRGSKDDLIGRLQAAA